jgi:hypothetical protein
MRTAIRSDKKAGGVPKRSVVGGRRQAWDADVSPYFANATSIASPLTLSHVGGHFNHGFSFLTTQLTT